MIGRIDVEILPTFPKFKQEVQNNLNKELANISANVKGTGKSIENSFSGAARSASGSVGQIGSRTTTAMRSAAKEGEGAFARIKASAKDAFGAIGGGKLLGVASAAGVIEFAKKSAETFERVGKESLGLQRVMGGTVKEASEWRGVMELAGVSADQFSVSVKKMSQQVVAAVPSLKAQEAAHAALAKAQQHLADLQTTYAGKANLSAGATIALRKAEQAVSDAIRLHGASSAQAAKAQQALADTRARLAGSAKLTIAEELKLRDAHNAVKTAQQALAASMVGGKSAFTTLGINVNDAAGHLKPMGTLLEEVANKFQKMAPGAVKNALAVQLFGRSGLQMLPFLNRGSAGMAALREEANKLGIVIGDKDVKAVKESIAIQREHKAAMEGLQIMIGRYVLPVIDKLIKFLTNQVVPAVKTVVRYIVLAVNGFKDFAKWVSATRGPIMLVAGIITALLLPSIISVGVATAASLGGAITLWIYYGVIALVSAAKAVAGFVMTQVAGFVAAASAVASFAVMIAGWIAVGAQALLGAAKVALAWLISIGPIALVIAAVIGLVYIIVKNWHTIWQFTVKIFTDVFQFLKRNWMLILAVITGPIGLLVFAVIKNWTLIKSTILRLTGDVLNFLKRVPGQIAGFFAAAGSLLLAAGKLIMKGLWDGIKFYWNISGYPFFLHFSETILKMFGKASTWLIDKGKDILTGLWDGIKSLGGWLVKQVESIIPGWIKDALGIASPPAWAIQIGKFIAQGLAKGITHFPHFLGNLAGMAKTAIAKALKDLAGGFVGQAQYNPSGQQQAEQSYAASLFPQFGWDVGQQLASLISLWNGESGWNPGATNPSSGAYGIPQALPADKMASAGADWLTNAATQISWGLNYIKSVYGSPAEAYATWLSRSPHWYEKGAWEIPRDELAMLHKKEMVIPAGTAEAIRRGPGTAGPAYPGAPVRRQTGGASDGITAAQLREALVGLAIRFDGDGLARLIADRQAVSDVKGPRR